MIVITGINSILGFELAKYLVKKSFKVIGTFRNENVRTAKLKKISEIKLVQIDLSDYKKVNDNMPDGDVLIHTVASHGKDLNDFSKLVSSNVVSSENVSNKANKLSFKKIIYTSSVSIYGIVDKGIINSTSPIYNPSAYGLTKYIGELAFKKNSTNIPCVALRLPAILAANSVRHFLSQILIKAKKGDPIDAYNPNNLFNNAVDIDYLCSFIARLINLNWTGFRAFPLGCSEPLSINEIISLIIKNTGSKSKINFIDKQCQSFIIDILDSENFSRYPTISTLTAIKNFVRKNQIV